MATAENVKSKIVLIGQPNVGKSVVFGCLTGKYTTVSNYPGTTVEVSRGTAKIGSETCEIIDTPGLYSIFPITEEERVTLKIIEDESPSLIVHVIDAKNLERMLSLTFQLQTSGIPMIVVLNMFDEAIACGFTIDTDALSSKLGLPVIATVAITKQGINQLIMSLRGALGDPACRQAGKRSPESNFNQEIASSASGGLAMTTQFSDSFMREWYNKAREISAAVVKKRKPKRGLTKLDKIIISPLSGSLILALVLYFGLYQFVGVFGAGTVVNFLETNFIDHINPFLSKIAAAYIPWPVLQDLFVGEYGILTLGVRYAIAIILPIVGLFFFVFAIIEDSGYLPRLSFLLDRIFKKIGLSGRAVIPMVLGLGCDTMATMVTRTLPTKRERLIATMLLSLCIPCSAQIGVILGLLGKTPTVLLAWFLIITTIFGVVGFLLSKLVPGAQPSFIVEIPPMRFPQIKNIVSKTFSRMKWYFGEIVPLFALASVLIWFFQLVGLFERAIKVMAYPLSLMGLPVSTAPAFIFGFFRRDYGAAGLYDLHKGGAFTNNQLLVAVTVLTLFLPCITQFLITIKERGLRSGIGISVFVFMIAFAVGVLLNMTLVYTHISF